MCAQHSCSKMPRAFEQFVEFCWKCKTFFNVKSNFSQFPAKPIQNWLLLSCLSFKGGVTTEATLTAFVTVSLLESGMSSRVGKSTLNSRRLKICEIRFFNRCSIGFNDCFHVVCLHNSKSCVSIHVLPQFNMHMWAYHSNKSAYILNWDTMSTCL